jgi:excisionase family DNA binding protein
MKNLILIPLEVDDLMLLIKEAVKEEFSKLPEIKSEDIDEHLDIAEAAKFLKKSKQTIYQYCSKNTIEYFKKGGKLYFLKKSLLAWIESGKNK